MITNSLLDALHAKNNEQMITGQLNLRIAAPLLLTLSLFYF